MVGARRGYFMMKGLRVGLEGVGVVGGGSVGGDWKAAAGKGGAGLSKQY